MNNNNETVTGLCNIIFYIFHIHISLKEWNGSSYRLLIFKPCVGAKLVHFSIDHYHFCTTNRHVQNVHQDQYVVNGFHLSLDVVR